MWTKAETDQLLHPDDANRIHAAMADLGYTLIPEEPLWQDYDGASHPSISRAPATWWIRYFDYL